MAVPGKKPEGKEYHNALAVMSKGKIEGLIRKSLLPTANELNDYRTFEPSKASGMQTPDTFCKACDKEDLQTGRLSEIHGHQYGISICADTWNDKEFFGQPTYERDPMNELALNNPEVFINCSTSPSRAHKENLKHNMLSSIASRYQTPYIYVNQVGAVDEVCCDGASRVYDAEGKLLARAKSFEEQFMVVNPFQSEGKIYPISCEASNERLSEIECKTKYNYDNDLERTNKNITLAIKDFFQDRNLDKAVIKVSNDPHSMVTAIFLSNALGADKVIAYSMNNDNPQLSNFADSLGIKYLNVTGQTNVLKAIGKDISGVIQSAITLFGQQEEKTTEPTKSTGEIDNKIEAFILSLVMGTLGKSVLIHSCDKSAIYFDKLDFYGDTSKSLAPLGDLPRSKVCALAEWMNTKGPVKNIIPKETIQKASKETMHGIPLAFLDEIIWNVENTGLSTDEMQTILFEYEKQNGPLSRNKKRKWLKVADVYLKEIGEKQWQLPPVVINEENSIAKSSYHQPLSYNSDWKAKKPEDIQLTLLSSHTK
jgi:predicted amidohydrolase/NH3-dependent NAD+ synthetase